LLNLFKVASPADLRKRSSWFLKISKVTQQITSIPTRKKLHLFVKMTLFCCPNSFQRIWVDWDRSSLFTKFQHLFRLWMFSRWELMRSTRICIGNILSEPCVEETVCLSS
jgi:hypothetical protein